MKSISKLKDDARKHEQKEEWEKAIKVYLEVLRVGEEGEAEVELSLYNRVGDLCVRLGRPLEAVGHYEQAADRYADAGLYNNAIALCNKALRYDASRVDLLLKLGQFSASQGFITDARRYFLDYAEKQFNAGEVDEALSALENFANVSEDPEVRELLAGRLRAHGRTDEAVAELRKAMTAFRTAGDSDGVARVRAQIEEIDPDAVTGADEPSAPALPSAVAAEPEHDGELPGLLDIDSGFEGPAVAEPPAAGGIEGFESTHLAEPETAEVVDEGGFTLDVTNFETAEEPEAVEPAAGLGIEGLETTSLDFAAAAAELGDTDLGVELEHDERSFDAPVLPEAEAEVEADGSFDLPTLDEDSTASFDLPGFDDDEAETGAGFDLPTLDDEADEPAEAYGSFDLPTLDDEEDTAEGFGSFDLPTLEDEEDTAEGSASFDLPTLDDDEEDTLEGTTSFDLPTLDEDEETEETATSYELPTLDEPAVTEDGLVEEPAEPAMVDIVDTDEPVEPEQLDEPEPIDDAPEVGAPGFDEEIAAEAGGPTSPPTDEEVEAAGGWTPDMSLPPSAPREEQKPAASAPVRDEPTGGDFIDLGELLAEDETEGTRFKVQETAPTGDEDRDFAELLSQFKAKVSEHLPAEDAVAHYDLGLAFKEMGLIDEAIAEFQIALRAGHMRLKVHEELGNCFLQKEQYNIAEKVLRRALEMPYEDELELLGVYYQLGRAYEGMGMRDQARDAYERVIGLDINFEDVAERLSQL